MSSWVLAHLKPRSTKLLLPMTPTTRLTTPPWPSDQLLIFSLLMIVYSRFQRSRCPLMQANAEKAGRKHLFLFTAWLSGLWELASRKDGGCHGELQNQVSAAWVLQAIQTSGVMLFSNIQSAWQKPPFHTWWNQHTPLHNVSGDSQGAFLSTSHLLLRSLASTALMS